MKELEPRSGYNAFSDIAFANYHPGLLITLIGSTMLGIALLRNGFRPRATSWLLTLNIPLAIVILQITSMGSAILPIVFAFAFVGRQIARELPAETAAVLRPRTASHVDPAQRARLAVLAGRRLRSRRNPQIDRTTISTFMAGSSAGL